MTHPSGAVSPLVPSVFSMRRLKFKHQEKPGAGLEGCP